MSTSAVSNHVDERGLEVWFELPPDVVIERIPMRKVVLHFKNRSQEPLRIYLPQSAPFRAGISTVTFAGGGAPLFEPEPRPHGYVVTEADFPLLAPGEERTFDQPFSLDPMSPGAGTTTARRPGFEPGTAVKVSWRYENRITRWQGGAQTLDGPSKKLFDGKDIPYIWTGELRAETSWTAP